MLLYFSRLELMFSIVHIIMSRAIESLWYLSVFHFHNQQIQLPQREYHLPLFPGYFNFAAAKGVSRHRYIFAPSVANPQQKTAFYNLIL